MSETTEVKTDESQEKKDAAAGFAAGFAKASGQQPAPGDTDADDKATGETSESSDAEHEAEEQARQKARADAEEKAHAEARAREAAQIQAAEKAAYEALPKPVRDRLESIDGLNVRMRNIEGHFGGLNSKLDAALATAKAAATSKGADTPSDKQVVAALADPEKWKQLKEDFPDWAGPVEAELSAMVARIEAMEKTASEKTDSGIDHENLLSAAEERAYIRLKHPDWRKVVNTKEFIEWSLSGGPSLRSYAQMKEYEHSNPEQAAQMRQAFSIQFPQWWEDRGMRIFSDSAEDAIHMLDDYSAHRQQLDAAAAERLKKEKRLERAVAPEGSGVAVSAGGISDDQAFQRGFKKVAKAGK